MLVVDLTEQCSIESRLGGKEVAEISWVPPYCYDVYDKCYFVRNVSLYSDQPSPISLLHPVADLDAYTIAEGSFDCMDQGQQGNYRFKVTK